MVKKKIKEAWEWLKVVWTPIYGEWMTEEDRRRERNGCRMWKVTLVLMAFAIILTIANVIIAILRHAG